MFGILELLILLIVFGGGATMLALVVFALLGKAPAIAAFLGAAFLATLLGAAVLFAFLAFVMPHSHRVAPVWAGGRVNDTVRTTVDGIQQFTISPGDGVGTRWSVSLTGMLFVFCAMFALLGVTARRLFAHGAACGRGRIWPAFLAVPLLALFFLGNVRVQKYSVAEQAARETEIRARDLQHHQEVIAKQAARMNTDMQSRIATMDIHDLMDKVDAPRIALPAQPAPTASAVESPSEPPIAPAPPAPEEAKLPPEAKDESPSELKAADAAGAATAHDKKNDERQGRHKTTSAKAVAESKPPKESSSETSEPPSHDGSSAVAIAKPNKVAPPRPSWVSEPPKRIGDVQREVIVTDEWSTEEECDSARDIGLMVKTYEHIQRLIGAYQGDPANRTTKFDQTWGNYCWEQLTQRGITLDYLRREVATQEFSETVERSIGPMTKLYTRVEFTPQIDRELRMRWDAYERRERFAMVGKGAGTLLALLGMVFGLLKIDTVTKGYYTKRLFLGVPAAIIGGSALCLVFAKLVAGFVTR